MFERRHAEGLGERMPEIANELVALKLDVIVTTCTPSTRLMYSKTRTVPLVMASVSDPVGQKLIASYAHPGGNITGLASQFEDIAGKMLGLFREAVPKASHVAVLFNAGNPVHKIFLREMEAAASLINVRLSPIAIGGKTDIAATFDGMAAQGVTGVLVLPDDPLLTNLRRRFVEMAAKHGMPSFFGLREAVEDGGLMSYGETSARPISALLTTWTRSSRARIPPNCRSSNPPGSSWSSIRRPHAPSVSRSRVPSCCVRTV